MFETKLFEVRDSMTFIPCIGINVRKGNLFPEENYLIGRAGFAYDNCILFGPLTAGEFEYDPYNWKRDARTLPIAHQYVTENWEKLKSGDIIDVSYILGETKEIKVSEKIGTAFLGD